MNLTNILKKMVEESNGKVRLVKVPLEKRPTSESIVSLKKEIGAQLDANNAMRQKSYINGSKKV